MGATCSIIKPGTAWKHPINTRRPFVAPGSRAIGGTLNNHTEGSSGNPRQYSHQPSLLTLYNLTVVLPFLAILVVLLLAADRADPLLARAAWVQLRWPVVPSGLLMFVGGVLAVLGGSGPVRQ